MKIFKIAALSLALSACTLAPNYERPTVSTPEIPQTMSEEQIAAYDLAWEDYFIDPRLQSLIRTALERNVDLRMATLNAEATRAQYGITFANLLPSIGASGNMNRARTSEDIYGPTAGISEQYSVGLGVTAWELDLFGRVRSLNEAAKQSYFSAKHSADAAYITIIAAVAKSYFAEKSAEETMRYAQETLKSREEAHRLSELSYKAGVISKIALNQSLSQIESAKVSLASAQTARNAAHNALMVLVGGQFPENLPAGKPLTIQDQFSNHVLGGISSELLNRRPDIRAAEASLLAANAQIGAARAAFFPSIRLTTSIGSASTELDGLFKGPAATWSFAPQITLPIFTWGANKANLDLAHARENIAVAQYEQTVQNAFKDVSDALNAQKTIQDQASAQDAVAQSSAEVLRLTEMRYKHGIASSLDRLDAQRNSFAAEMALIQTRLQQLNNRVDLYKVLGGGLSTAHVETSARVERNRQPENQ